MPLAAARLDRATRLADDVLHDREPEPRAARRARVVGSVEALEQARQLLLVDADTVVAPGQEHAAVVALDDQSNVVPGPA